MIDNKFDEIEFELCKMAIPIKSLEVITAFLKEYIYDDISIELHKNQHEKNKNIFSILHLISLIQNDIKDLRQSCYDILYKK